MEHTEPGYSYFPERGKGIALHLALCLLLIGLEVFLVLNFALTQVGLQFFLLLIAMMIFAVPLVFLLYRLYSLLNASYDLKRDGLHIRWGQRREVIPLNAIEWIRRPEEMNRDVPWSVLPMPGAYLGTVPTRDGVTFEFLASSMDTMLFLGTSRYIYVISPEDPDLFLMGFERVLQMGALDNVRWESRRPANWLLEAFRNKVCRISLILSVNLLTVLFILVGSRFQVTRTISLSFSPLGEPTEELGAVNMLVVPLSAVIIGLAGFALGLRLFQAENCRRTAELVWGAATAAILQCLIAALLIF